MKWIALAVLAAILPTIEAAAITLKPDPDYSFAWSSFAAVEMADDSTAIAASGNGFLSARWDAKTLRLSPLEQCDVPGIQIERFIVEDSIIVAVGSDKVVRFLDRLALPKISILGQARLPDSTLDIVMRGRDLYLAAGFRGLLHGRLDSYSALTLLDSSQVGVHVVAVHMVDDHLVAADDYNGILDYALDPAGTPLLAGKLDLPYPCDGLGRMGDTLLITAGDHNTLALAVRSSQSWQVVGTVAPPYGCERVYVIDTLVVVIARDLAGISLLSRRNLTPIDFVPSESGHALRYPSLFRRDSQSYLLVTGYGGGFLMYNLGNVPYTSAAQVYPFSGEITSMALRGSRFVAGGSSGWCRTWVVDADMRVDSQSTLFDNGGSVGALAKTYFGLVALNTQFNKMNLLKDSAGRLIPYNTLFFGHAIGAMFWPPLPDRQVVVVWSGSTVYLYRWLQDDLVYTSRVTAPLGITAACILNNLVVISVAKFGVQVYQIGPNGELWHAAALQPDRDITLLMRAPGWNNCLIGYGNDRVYRLNFSHVYSPLIDTSATLPFPVSNAYLHDTLVFTTGYYTTAVWAISQASLLPVMLASCNRGGSMVAGNEDVLFLTSGQAVLGYDLRGPTAVDDSQPPLPDEFALLGNYPNPFNPTTTIEYSLQTTQNVQLVIYNTLGRRVRSLVNQRESYGIHRVRWDGRDDTGSAVASGVYYYRLAAGDDARIGKMVLIR
jgi:hypothetical protein